MAGPVTGGLGRGLSSVASALWEGRRRLYEWGVKAPERVPARVVSIGNLTVGGAGKTTLVLHLARSLRALGEGVAVVARRYRPGPGGRSDEELLYREAIGAERTFAGARKLALAREAARAGARLVLVDDGFSHWALERDLDIVLVDRTDPWGGGLLLPAGRLREPLRALQRADVVVVTRLSPGEDPGPWLEEARRRAPAALVAAARHEVVGARALDGAPLVPGGPARLLTATGNPRAVAASAREAGYHPVELSAYRDHHWWTAGEAEREHRAAGPGTLLLTPKDAVRWPAGAPRERVAVLEPRWRWLHAGDQVERRVREADR